MLQVGNQPSVNGIFAADIAEHHSGENQKSRLFQERHCPCLFLLPVRTVIRHLRTEKQEYCRHAAQHHKKESGLPGCNAAQQKKGHRCGNGTDGKARMQNIGCRGAAVSQDVHRVVVEIRNGATSNTRKHKSCEKKARSTGNGHQGHPQESQGGQKSNGPAASQPEGHNTRNKSGNHVADRMSGQQHPAEGI